MFSKVALTKIFDEFSARRVEVSVKSGRESYIITPVFHVEKLYVDCFFDDLQSFCRQFHDLTGTRAVLTCMTPESPILAKELKEQSFHPERYWERIEKLKPLGVIGLHGHYVRGFDETGPSPMHCWFHDINHVKGQLDIELNSLISRCLIDDKIRVYSGGWWFTSDELRKHLVERGFSWDYTVSSSMFNRSQGSDALKLSVAGGCLTEDFGNGILKSPAAVSGISKASRPFHAFHKIRNQAIFQRSRRSAVSLYSHDYDLHLESSMLFVKRALTIGLRFEEPNSLGTELEKT